DWQATYHQNYPSAARWLSDVTVDLSAKLPGMGAPTLLLWGESDPISPVAVGERLRDLLPHARLHVLKGGDHDLVHARAGERARRSEERVGGGEDGGSPARSALACGEPQMRLGRAFGTGSGRSFVTVPGPLATGRGVLRYPMLGRTAGDMS